MNVRWEEKNNAKANQSKFLAIWDAVGGVDPRRLSHKHLAFITMRRRRPTSTARTHKTAQNETINVISTSWPVSNEVLWFMLLFYFQSKFAQLNGYTKCHVSCVTTQVSQSHNEFVDQNQNSLRENITIRNWETRSIVDEVKHPIV